jgi:hypothetical protein
MSEPVGSALAFQLMLENVCRNDWETITPESWSDLVDEADATAVMAAEVAVYAGMRGGNGCGDHGHEAALEAARKARVKVRRALGFSYP